MEAKELGELLKDNGLIDESLLVFEVQTACPATTAASRTVPTC